MVDVVLGRETVRRQHKHKNCVPVYRYFAEWTPPIVEGRVGVAPFPSTWSEAKVLRMLCMGKYPGERRVRRVMLVRAASRHGTAFGLCKEKFSAGEKEREKDGDRSSKTVGF